MRQALIILVCYCVTPAQWTVAGIVFDSGGFESYPNNTELTSHPDWEGVTAGNRFRVQSSQVKDGNRAISVTDSTVQAAYVRAILNPRPYVPASGEIVVVEVDIARTAGEAVFEASSEGVNVDIQGDGSGASGERVLQFGLAVETNSIEIRPFYTQRDGSTAGTDVYIPLNVDQLEWVNFRAELDFASDRYRLIVTDGQGASFDTGLQDFVVNATGLFDASLNHNPRAQATDVGYYDNYRITTVPEPGSAGIICCLLSLVSLRRSGRRFLI